jgi:penicillin-binding protein 1B
MSLVWVGYDSNAATRLSGARAALPIWARFTTKVRPPEGERRFRQPPGVTTAAIDPLSGGLATGLCPRILTEVFVAGTEPDRICYLHGDRSWRPEREAKDGFERRRRRWRWLRKIFGEKDERQPG